MELVKEYFNENANETIKIYKINETSYKVLVGTLVESYFTSKESALEYASSVTILNG